MAKHDSLDPEKAVDHNGSPPVTQRPNPRFLPEESLHDWGEEDEPYADPEHARRMAAVRTELFRRTQRTWEPEE